MKITGADIDDLGTKAVLATTAFLDLKFDFALAKGKCESASGKECPFSELKPCVNLLLGSNHGDLCGHISICRHLAEAAVKGAVDEAALFNLTDMTSWLEFFHNGLFMASRCGKGLPADGTTDAYVGKVVKAINGFLAGNTFLVGESLGVSDLVLVVTLDHLVAEEKLLPSFLDSLVHLARLTRTVKASDAFLTFSKMLVTFKATGSLFDTPKEAPKDEPKPKVKNPMDLLPPTSFSLDQWKKTYSNCKGDLYSGVMPWLWENFDPAGWTFYFMKYNKLEDECTSEIFTSNMLSGFLQRFETELRHYSFAVLNVLGSGSAFDIKGVWLVRGTELPELITSHPSFEFHSFDKLDVTNEADKKVVADYFCACDDIDGVPIADCKVWK
ncbi:elongation factor 1 gamma, putative [Theileria equi strain WA]|uniref:Elongation factor 1 gamma, putative n=1 Tax=Theileria equi strain WA TaxID=1537102 RepID=L0B2F9_THEEQ|nr:elongation factor 1 gamma, putative [Theileria equi strain WA]AFZ81396.1 elongation factor 1 gamma, putative [Theileria equi strain WA]|eukprot:XP_004831062.1 elongation factor 1 gamma, putative [Theileria equi strain WA]